jgi:peroxiredoxin
MIRNIRILFVIVIFFQFSCTDQHKGIFKLTLKTIHSTDFSLQQLGSNKTSVIVFLSPECPMCQNYSLTLNQLCDKYKSQGVNFYGVFAGKDIDSTEIKKYIETYAIKFDLLTDEKKQLVHILEAEVTPEVYVLNSKAEVLYKGSIDNWLNEPGQKRTVITEHYLDDVLQAVALNTEMKIRSTEAKGCLIE